MLSKRDIEVRLNAAGAFYGSDADDVHEIWVTSWGFEIWVPMAGPYGGLDERDIAEIEAEIIASRPPNP